MKPTIFQPKRIDPQLLLSYRSQSGETIDSLSTSQP